MVISIRSRQMRFCKKESPAVPQRYKYFALRMKNHSQQLQESVSVNKHFIGKSL